MARWSRAPISKQIRVQRSEPLALAVVVALGHLHVARLVGGDVHAQPVVRGRVDRHRAHLAAPVLLGRAALLRGGHLGSDEKRKNENNKRDLKMASVQIGELAKMRKMPRKGGRISLI